MRSLGFSVLSFGIHLVFVLFFLGSVPFERSDSELFEAEIIHRTKASVPPASEKKIQHVSIGPAVPTDTASKPSEDAASTQAVSSQDLLTDPASGNDLSERPHVLQEFRVEYPRRAKRAGIEGDVLLKVVINKDGRVEDVKVLKPLGYGLDEAASVAMTKFLFSPGLRYGKAVRTWIQYRYRFRLE